VVALLVSEFRESRVGVWIAKPLASTGFVALALANHASATAYGRWVLAALCLCWLGDVLLIPRERPVCFQAGILSFLLGHAAFAWAFAPLNESLGVAVAAAIVLAPTALLVLRWLQPHVPADFRLPVYAYIAVITLMMISAVGAGFHSASLFVVLGAGMFYLSDLSVARDRFVDPSFWNGAWGLPLYFGGQLLLASSPLQVAA
jgi:uncharacterized membrane protein YhhN